MADSPILDLHNHSLHSDGLLSPQALVELAARRGVETLALTDHDTIDGLEPARARGVELGIEVVPGIELSIDEDGLDIHLLGYFVSRPEVLRDALSGLRVERERRAAQIVARLLELGVPIEYDAVRARALGGVVGRPHVAEEMVACGHALNLNDAFDRFLGSDRPAYIAKRALGLQEGVALLRAAGAVPVVAHPGPSGLSGVLPHLAACGVLGLEVWHPKHDGHQTRRFGRLAERHGFVPTGGSDFHREIPGGVLPGDMAIPREVLDALRRLAA